MYGGAAGDHSSISRHNFPISQTHGPMPAAIKSRASGNVLQLAPGKPDPPQKLQTGLGGGGAGGGGGSAAHHDSNSATRAFRTPGCCTPGSFGGSGRSPDR